MENKYLEYYFDSKTYSEEEVKKSIDNTIKEFPNKNVKVYVTLNNFGIYVVIFEFKNKDTIFSKMKINFDISNILKNSKVKIQNLNKNLIAKSKKTKQQKQQERLQKRFDKYSGKDIFYGEYKSTGLYRPY